MVIPTADCERSFRARLLNSCLLRGDNFLMLRGLTKVFLLLRCVIRRLLLGFLSSPFSCFRFRLLSLLCFFFQILLFGLFLDSLNYQLLRSGVANRHSFIAVVFAVSFSPRFFLFSSSIFHVIRIVQLLQQALLLFNLLGQTDMKLSELFHRGSIFRLNSFFRRMNDFG